jgi:indolepyruvate ferredoxin oxidoreductase
MEYEQLVVDALGALSPDTHGLSVELCELPDVIRGYEEIKLRNVALFRKRADAVRSRLRRRATADTAAR